MNRLNVPGIIATILITAVAGPVPAAQPDPVAGQPFDAAPFGMSSRDPEGRWQEIRWGEPRKIRQVVVQAAGDKAVVGSIRVQYWHGSWDGGPDTILAESGAHGQGWASIDDWTNGRWKDADAKSAVAGTQVRFTFAPTNEKEFKNIVKGVAFRRTLKIRIVSDQRLPDDFKIQALTDAVYRPVTARILWGRPAEPSIKTEPADPTHLEVFNGTISAIRPAGPGIAKIEDGMHWTIPADGVGGIEADLLAAVDPVDNRYDRTIVTVRSQLRPFSFAVEEVARGDRILVDDLGVLVVRGDDAIGLEEYRQFRREWAGPTVYERVFNEPEQTLARAVQDMPLRRPMLEYVHGLPGNRNVMRQFASGDLLISGIKHWFIRPNSPKDSAHKDWAGDMLEVRFGFPAEALRGGRDLEESWLPLLRTWWKDGAIDYEQSAIMDKIDGHLGDVQLDDPTVLLIKVRILNTSPNKAGTARLAFATTPKPMPPTLEKSKNPGDETLIFKDGRVLAERDGKQLLRLIVRGDAPGTVSATGKAVQWSLELPPGASHEIFVAVPSITLSDEAQIEGLVRRDFEADARRICEYWRRLIGNSTRIDTPEPWLNDFHKTHLLHMFINSVREPGSQRLFPHVGTFCYGVYGNEAALMVSDLDRRGCHDMARRCLDPWLQYQGTVGLPGSFKTKEGVFYGTNGHESGGYNMHHGYVMWNMAEHWKFTRDREWMQRAGEGLVKACDWVTRERQATMTTSSDGRKPIEYGFLPAGSLEDVQDYWYWLATNAATVWGFDACAAALADYGHPQAARIVEQAKAYHDDVMRALTESRVRTPVVRLRDGTYVPKYPSNLYDRGRAHGWIRETLEGAIYLPALGLLTPDAPETRWIMKDYEDNLYISDRYGYSIPIFERFWFSRGGFCIQANLLDGPLPYLKRDEVKHYLRAFFNGFASAFEPGTRMCGEGSAPELGYSEGDHFKTSDEAQCTRWLRLMFVHEQGNDLYLGQAIPRYWMADGKAASIQNAASYFGPLSLRLTSQAAKGTLQAELDPPKRNAPSRIYVRLRHPDGKPIRQVTLNGTSSTLR